MEHSRNAVEHHKPFASTLHVPVPRFEDQVELLNEPRVITFRSAVIVMIRVIRATLQGRPVIGYSSHGPLFPELWAAAVIGMFPARLRTGFVLVGEMWEPSGGMRGRLERLFIRAADRGIDRYLLTSRTEARDFPDRWGLSNDGERIGYATFPFCEGTYKADQSQVSDEGYVFSGGDSFRDYDDLIEIVRDIPKTRLVIATMNIPSDREDLPSNVEVHNVRVADYFRLAKGARVVVAPLRMGLSRSCGILTVMLGQIALKPVVASDAYAVRDFVEDGVTGYLYDGSKEDLRRLLEFALSPDSDEELKRVAAAGEAQLRGDFSMVHYGDTILNAVKESEERWRSLRYGSLGMA